MRVATSPKHRQRGLPRVAPWGDRRAEFNHCPSHGNPDEPKIEDCGPPPTRGGRTLHVKRSHPTSRIVKGRDGRACRQRKLKVQSLKLKVPPAPRNDSARLAGVPLLTLFGSSSLKNLRLGSEQCQGWQPRGALWGEGRAEIKGIFHTPGPVPGTVEIESQYEVDTSAAVPGTAMEIGMRGWQPAGGSGRDGNPRQQQYVCSAAVSAALLVWAAPTDAGGTCVPQRSSGVRLEDRLRADTPDALPEVATFRIVGPRRPGHSKLSPPTIQKMARPIIAPSRHQVERGIRHPDGRSVV